MFAIPINGIYKIKGVGDVITGRVEQGTINAGDAVRIAPRGINGLKVFSIEMHHKTWPNAKEARRQCWYEHQGIG